ncbi:MAG: hypothetical protein EOP24_26315 [Hyphomicrobiales bacterium]|nr:MAG: hypothetical protein EOP24_26315 [Hyphomicrobiales bacterium]
MAYKVITPPPVEPITVAEFRLHQRLDPDDTTENTAIEGFISAAREWTELYIGFAVAEQTVELALDAYPSGAVALEGGPVSAVTSVKYLDASGVEQTLSNALYALDDYSTPNWLTMAYGTYWPATYAAANALKVRYVIGTGTVAASIKAAMLLLAGHLYENREEVSSVQNYAVPMGVKALLSLHRVNMGL